MTRDGAGAFLRGWWGRLTHTLAVLLRVMVPIFLLISLLEASGWIEEAGRWLGAPLALVGIGPRAAIALLVGAFAGLYAAIGSMASLGLTPAEALPVALFLQFAHALPMEAAVAHQGGVSGWRHAAARVAMGVVAAAAAPLLAPLARLGEGGAAGDVAATEAAGVATAGAVAPATPAVQGFGPVLLHSLGALGETLLLLVAILAPLTLLIQLLEHSGWLERWSIATTPWMRRVGWTGEAAFPLLTGLFLGLIYGAGVMIERFQRGKLNRREGWELFLFLGACHSILEDPFIFTVSGVGPGALLPTRILAGLLVLLGLGWKRRGQSRSAAGYAQVSGG
ncbi:nucleoside recognition domain-containing protein [Limnochorda pilosa]|uniref:Membrane protein n=1 Tax=Limnochorda pilosa TaxID=1555112 RepID=A0A0K2SP47_LIMPI|nr:nucleoside recognition domain-containing protein [Limnochorda pilosa]BAS28767.1 membrane protein [Limnochorda pilosa]